MNAEQLSNYVADHLEDYFHGSGHEVEPFIEFTPEIPATIAEVEVESQYESFRVFILPYGETETRINRGDSCQDTKTVNVIVNGPLSDTIDRGTAIAFVEQLRRSLRRTEFEGYRWHANNVSSYLSFTAIRKEQFYSVFQAEFVGIS